MKRFFLMTIEFILFCGLIYLSWVNYQAKTITGISLGLDGYTNLVYGTFLVLIVTWFVGLLSGTVSSLKTIDKYKEMIRSYSKKTNEMSMQSESDYDEKESMKRKITALEIALQKALKDNEELQKELNDNK